MSQTKLISFSDSQLWASAVPHQQSVVIATQLIQSCQALKLSGFIYDIFSNISATKAIKKKTKHFIKSCFSTVDVVPL